MHRQTDIHPHNALLPLGTPMYDQLIERIKRDESLSDTRRRDLVSGLRRVAKALGLPPEDVPADGRWLQPRLIGSILQAWD